jgi:cytochrome P450
MSMTLTTQAAIAPGGWPVLGHALALLRRPLEFLASLPAQGDLVEIRIGPQRMWVVCCPELTHHVLRDGRTYDKGGPLYDQARMVGGDGLLTCAHGPHQRQRRLLQPAFTRDRLAVYATEMSRQLDAALATWHDGQVIDVLAAMDEITTRVTARALFTTPLSPQQSTDLLHSLTVIVEGLFLRAIMPAWLRRVPLAVNRRVDQASSTMDTLTYEIINAYRREGVDHGDLLSMMLAARDEHGDALTDTEIRDQVLTFWGAGTETTAALLAWSLHLLAQHPQVTRRLQTEVDAVLGGRVAGHDDVARLDYTTRVLTETLRLYPPGWILTRVLTTEATLAGRTLPAGTILINSPYLIHRRGDLYPDPNHFDPDRWLPDHTTTLPRGAFIPFGGGTRRCIGDTFAMLEATLALATITTRWHLHPLPGMTTQPRARVTLRPHPLRMQLHHRH